MKNNRNIWISIVIVLFGGTAWFLGYWFGSNVIDRQLRHRLDCSQCERKKDVLGYLASVGFQLTPYLAPNHVETTSRCTVIEHTKPIADHHYVAFPRKDILDITGVDSYNVEYVLDCLNEFKKLIEKHGLKEYRIYTNGQGYQEVRMLHFHLVSIRGFLEK